MSDGDPTGADGTTDSRPQSPTSPHVSRERAHADSVTVRRGLLLIAAGLVPWAVVPYDAGASFVFSFGLVNPDPVSLEPLHRYVFVDTGYLPESLLAWPVASVLYALAVGSAALGTVGREDRRVTAGLLALAGADLLYFAVTFSSVRMGVLALPVGVAVLWLAAWVSRPAVWFRV